MLLRDIWSYLKAVRGHGFARMTGGIGGVLFLLIGVVPMPNAIPSGTTKTLSLLLGLFLLLVVAPFLAWREEHRKVQATEDTHTVRVSHRAELLKGDFLTDKTILRVSIWTNIEVFQSSFRIELDGPYSYAMKSFLGAGEEAGRKQVLGGKIENSRSLVVSNCDIAIGPNVTLLVDVYSETALKLKSVERFEDHRP